MSVQPQVDPTSLSGTCRSTYLSRCTAPTLVEWEDRANDERARKYGILRKDWRVRRSSEAWLLEC